MALVRILAFDPGTANMGYAMLLGNIATSEVRVSINFGVLKTAKWRGELEVPIRERIDQLGLLARGLVGSLKPTFMVIEDFVEQGKFVGKTYKEMAFLTEHMRLLGYSMGIDVTIYANGYWKRKTLKTAHANKNQVKHFISHKLPETVELLKGQPDHVWDSAGIGYCKWLEISRL